MKITFNEADRMSANPFTNVAGVITSYENSGTGKSVKENTALDISSKVTDNTAYKGHGRTVRDVMLDAEAIDIDVQRDYLTVMSNCVSDKDFAKMQKEGFNPSNIEKSDVVTIVDHIKTALIKGGTEVLGYTDTVDDDVLQDITGSSAYANELKRVFAQKDIPLTADNAKEVQDGFDELSKLPELSESGKKYLIENNLNPTVNHLYTATYSSGSNAEVQGKGYYKAGEVAGYYAKKPEKVDIEALRPQIERIISEAGFEPNTSNVEKAAWLVEKGIPLTAETFLKLQKAEKVNIPMKYEEFAIHAANAISDGIHVKDADLSLKNSLREEAFAVNEEVQTLGSIKGRRVLEEVRLHMTAEANLKLLRSGFSIDTAPMEDLIRNLKEIEKEYAISLTGDKDETNAVRKKDLFENTLSFTDTIKQSPISISLSIEPSDSFEIVGQRAENLSLQYQKAGNEYEAFMTAPRADLGDSIKKAFESVDEILENMDMALTEENRRAVRILGYNNMEITEDRLLSVKEKDRLLKDTIVYMTPGRVLGMIRNNVNPLKMSIGELNKYLKEQITTVDDMESYSKFLYRLERDEAVSETEKTAYIGIYRLINQIEKGDYASVGVIEQLGTEFDFEHMLSALRTRKHKKMDYRVDDAFGGINVVDRGIASITTQIAGGYIKDTADLKAFIDSIGTGEADKERNSEESEEFRQMLKTEREVLEALENSGVPVTARNIANMEAMMNEPASVFARLRNMGFKKAPKAEISSRKEAEESVSGFTGSVKDFLKERVFSDSEDMLSLSAMDIDVIRDIYTQMELMERRADEEEYMIPANIGDETTLIRLKVLSGTGNGEVAVSFDSRILGKVAVTIKPKDQGWSGFGSCVTKEGTELLRSGIEDLREGFRREGLKLEDMIFASNEGLDLNEFAGRTAGSRNNDREVVSDVLLYKAASVFIEYCQKLADRERT